MDDLRLREMVRPLADAIAPMKSIETQRTVREAFRTDGKLDIGVIAGTLPEQRIDVVVPPSTAAGVRPERLFIPEASRVTRLALMSTGNVSATFEVDVLVNGVVRSGGAIRSGMSSSTGVFSVDLPAGSVLSLQTKASIAQAVTVTVFYRPGEG